MSEPMVSVCCITYNHEHFIADALEGFLMQETTFPIEILIGEDCSTDGTLQVIQSYEAKYPNRLTVLHREPNLGGTKNLRDLFSRAQGKYIALCEGDDYWTDPYKLQRQVDQMESHPQCTLCFHAAKVVRVSGVLVERDIRPFDENRILTTDEVISIGSGNIPTQSKLLRREALKDLPDWYRTAPVGDLSTDILMASRGCAIYIDKKMSIYRRGVPGSWSQRMYNSPEIVAMKKDSLHRCIAFYRSFDEASGKAHSNVLQHKIRLLETGLDLFTETNPFRQFINIRRMINQAGIAGGIITSIKYLGLRVYASHKRPLHKTKKEDIQ